MENLTGLMRLPIKYPSETDSPESLMPDLAALRNEALKQGDFESAVMLSHVHAWLHWANEVKKVFDEHTEDIKKTGGI
jgi:hypothetical protein